MSIENCKVEYTKTTKFHFKDYLFNPNDQKVRVTVCNDDILYTEWRQKISKAIGKDLINTTNIEHINIIADDFKTQLEGPICNINKILDKYFSTPCNIRISIGTRVWIFILKPRTQFIGLFQNNDFNVRTSFFVTDRIEPLWLQEAKLICKISSILGKQLYNSNSPLSICLTTTGMNVRCFSVSSLIEKIKTEVFFCKDIRIDIDNKTWIIYIIESN